MTNSTSLASETNLANSYRPQGFADVIGQQQTVATLVALAKSRRPRNILLTGAYGSGKTSLVRILAEAWNCQRQPTIDGSPCGDCSYCRGDHGSGLAEYTVTTSDGSSDFVCAVLEREYRTPTEYNVHTIFLDEAHGLSSSGIDALLKVTEEPLPGISFCLATTEPWKLSGALKSRFMDFAVRPLRNSDSIGLLQRIADAEGVAFDIDALSLIAAIKHGHPRDMISGLEHVAISNPRVTVEAVRRSFGIDLESHILRYFRALATADYVQQHRILDEWPADLSTKVGWIRAFLLSLYHHDVMSHELAVDPVIDSIKGGRTEIIAAFRERLCPSQPQKLADVWRQMLSFWSIIETDDDVTLRLRLTIFEDRVNRAAFQEVSDRKVVVRSRDNEIDQRKYPFHRTMSAGELRTDSPSTIFGPTHVKEIINRVSAFAQLNGRYMNAAMILTPTFAAMKNELEAVSIIRAFARDLEAFVNSQGSCGAIVTVLDQGPNGLVGRLLCSMPYDGSSTQDSFTLKDFCSSWTYNGSDRHHIELTTCGQRSISKFHWDAVASIASRMTDIEGLDPEKWSPLAEGLIAGLNIKLDEKYSGPVLGPVVHYSALLSDQAISEASANGMGVLSALDDGAYDWLRRGWELKEFNERQRVQDIRAKELADVENDHPSVQDQKTARLKIIASWQTDPKDRKRTSLDWWWISSNG